MDQNKQILWIDDDIKSSILRPYVDEFFDNRSEEHTSELQSR